MISALEVWALSGQGGAPSLYKTLAGYAQRGHEVEFVSATVGAKLVGSALRAAVNASTMSFDS